LRAFFSSACAFFALALTKLGGGVLPLLQFLDAFQCNLKPPLGLIELVSHLFKGFSQGLVFLPQLGDFFLYSHSLSLSERSSLNRFRLSATLLFIGEVVLLFVALVLHPGGGPTEEATFAIYAGSSAWATIHLGQFVCTAVLLAGLLVLYFALNVSEGTPRWLGFLGAIATGVALVLAAVESAVDGVALKQAVDAWVSTAPGTEKIARFASAQALRWLEWGTVSYQNFMLGLALVLFAIVIVWTARVTRPIGYLMGASGLACGGLVGGNRGLRVHH